MLAAKIRLALASSLFIQLAAAAPNAPRAAAASAAADPPPQEVEQTAYAQNAARFDALHAFHCGGVGAPTTWDLMREMCGYGLRSPAGTHFLSMGAGKFAEFCAKCVVSAETANMVGGSTYFLTPTLLQHVANNGKSDLTNLYGLFKALREDSASNVRMLPDNFQRAIAEFDNKLETSFKIKLNGGGSGGMMGLLFPTSQMAGYGDSDDVKALASAIRRRQTLLLGIPTAPKPVNQLSPEDIHELVSRQPPEQHGPLRILVSKIKRAASSPDGNHDALKSVTRPQAFFYGPPGVGKTTFARQLGEKMGLPLCEISLGGGGSGQGNFGGSYRCEATLGGAQIPSIMDRMAKDYTDEFILGKLAFCMVKHGVTNPIIFIDEADVDPQSRAGQQISELKLLMDPKRKTLEIPALGIEMDFSRATIILAGNTPIPDAALNTRIPRYDFGALSMTEKRNAQAKEAAGKLADISREDGEEIARRVRLEAAPFLEYLLEKDAEAFPGARVLEEVTGDVLELVSESVRSGEHIDAAYIQQQIDKLLSARNLLQNP